MLHVLAQSLHFIFHDFSDLIVASTNWFYVQFTVADDSIWKDAGLSSWSPFTRLNSELIRSRFSSRQTSSAQCKV